MTCGRWRSRRCPGVVEVDDLLEALQDAIVHVRLHERRVRPHVDVAVVGVRKRPRNWGMSPGVVLWNLVPSSDPTALPPRPQSMKFLPRGYTRWDC